MSDIRWLDSIESAMKEAERTNKLILLFFHRPDCGGCKKSFGITFVDPRVSELVNSEFASAKFEVTEAQDLSASYKVEWTPTFIITDEHGKELERWVGYLPPADFIAQAHLSEGLAEFHMKRYREAEGMFAWIIDNSPDAAVAPEARYFMGVSLYRDTNDPAHLARTWESMSRRYPESEWTKKASAWS